MATNINIFVVGVTDELWATIYRKRKLARRDLATRFDPAAQINQPGVNPPKRQDWQDQAVQKHFRAFVDYVVEVSTASEKHNSVSKHFHFRR